MFRIALLLVICCVSAGLATRRCSNPLSYYNTLIDHPRAFKCSDGTTAQCVSPIFKLCNGPNTGSWRKGLKVNANCNQIQRNTAIASFSGSSGTRYNGNNGHAAIFIACLPGGSIKVADQWCGKSGKFNERTLPKSCSSSNPYSNCADYFYTIEW